MSFDLNESIRRKARCTKRGLLDPLKGLVILTSCVALLLSLVLILPVVAQDEISITILHTNDLHGIMLPFEEEGRMVGGFSRISTIVREVRQKEEHVLLVDAGDTIMEDQHLMANYFRGEPVTRLMNQMAYDLAVPGNHDFEFGLDVLAQRIGEADFTYLAANIVPAAEPNEAALDLTSQMKPYTILSVAGVRIGFLGLTQPLHGFSGIEIEDTVQMAQEYVPQIREQADIVVVMTHQMLARDYEIVEKTEGIDILLAAHEHDIVFEHGLMRNGTLIAKTSAWGREVGKVDLTIERGPDGFNLTEAQASLLLVTSEVAEDEEINRILESYVTQTKRYRTYMILCMIGAFLGIVAVLAILVRRAVKSS
jgi:2',3'-cyclic-nucleotide 2'-phosphodiesterase (5'-nucleotidase family)